MLGRERVGKIRGDKNNESQKSFAKISGWDTFGRNGYLFSGCIIAIVKQLAFQSPFVLIACIVAAGAIIGFGYFSPESKESDLKKDENGSSENQFGKNQFDRDYRDIPLT